ncbi:MAG: hypothetical protein KatS3mg110_0832 [Pirellulaceae bacterium]|nr:MAG: hypothetical protein KatS3mg110_0832 [Pirellulaceae bacterium]
MQTLPIDIRKHRIGRARLGIFLIGGHTGKPNVLAFLWLGLIYSAPATKRLWEGVVTFHRDHILLPYYPV